MEQKLLDFTIRQLSIYTRLERVYNDVEQLDDDVSSFALEKIGILKNGEQREINNLLRELMRINKCLIWLLKD